MCLFVHVFVCACVCLFVHVFVCACVCLFLFLSLIDYLATPVSGIPLLNQNSLHSNTGGPKVGETNNKMINCSCLHH